MALTVGINCGLVTTAPTSDPDGGSAPVTIDNYVRTVQIITSSAITITEIGWYTDTATEESNFEIGIYDVSTELPVDLIWSNLTNAKGTDAGWKKVTGLNIELDASTKYWVAVQCDNTATTTTIDREAISDEKYAFDSGESTLPNPWVGITYQDNQYLAIYAVYEVATEPTYTSINIDDDWKTISGAAVVKINIGDAWKNVATMQINIGDSWKAVTIT